MHVDDQGLAGPCLFGAVHQEPHFRRSVHARSEPLHTIHGSEQLRRQLLPGERVSARYVTRRSHTLKRVFGSQCQI